MADKITDLIKRASEAAKAAPENLREAAFNKAFDLMATEQGGAAHGGTPRASTNRAAAKPPSASPAVVSSTAASLDKLDRTAHPKIQHSDTSLNNSLRLLRAAKDELRIDGLSASVIAKALVDKFRCRITQQAISSALNGAGRYVNRHKDGNQVIFRIMAPGEEYLDQLKNDPRATPTNKRSTKKKRAKPTAVTKVAGELAKPVQQPKAPKSRNAEKSATAEKDGAAKKTAQRAVSPNAALKQIHAAGFFSQPRTIGAIIEHLKHQHGRSFKAFEMSTPLLRLLRAGVLTRNKNSDNQYEYQQH